MQFRPELTLDLSESDFKR